MSCKLKLLTALSFFIFSFSTIHSLSIDETSEVIYQSLVNTADSIIKYSDIQHELKNETELIKNELTVLSIVVNNSINTNTSFIELKENIENIRTLSDVRFLNTSNEIAGLATDNFNIRSDVTTLNETSNKRYNETLLSLETLSEKTNLFQNQSATLFKEIDSLITSNIIVHGNINSLNETIFTKYNKTDWIIASIDANQKKQAQELDAVKQKIDYINTTSIKLYNETNTELVNIGLKTDKINSKVDTSYVMINELNLTGSVQYNATANTLNKIDIKVDKIDKKLDTSLDKIDGLNSTSLAQYNQTDEKIHLVRKELLKTDFTIYVVNITLSAQLNTTRNDILLTSSKLASSIEETNNYVNDVNRTTGLMFNSTQFQINRISSKVKNNLDYLSEYKNFTDQSIYDTNKNINATRMMIETFKLNTADQLEKIGDEIKNVSITEEKNFNATSALLVNIEKTVNIIDSKVFGTNRTLAIVKDDIGKVKLNIESINSTNLKKIETVSDRLNKLNSSQEEQRSSINKLLENIQTQSDEIVSFQTETEKKLEDMSYETHNTTYTVKDAVSQLSTYTSSVNKTIDEFNARLLAIEAGRIFEIVTTNADSSSRYSDKTSNDDEEDIFDFIKDMRDIDKLLFSFIILIIVALGPSGLPVLAILAVIIICVIKKRKDTGKKKKEEEKSSAYTVHDFKKLDDAIDDNGSNGSNGINGSNGSSGKDDNKKSSPKLEQDEIELEMDKEKNKNTVSNPLENNLSIPPKETETEKK